MMVCSTDQQHLVDVTTNGTNHLPQHLVDVSSG